MNITKVTEQYYANNAKELRKIVDNIVKPFGGLSQKDMDDFYSLANEVFWIAVNDFNGVGTFKGFLYFRLKNKIRSFMSQKNRKKRSDVREHKSCDGHTYKIYLRTLSLDEPYPWDNSECNNITIGEMIESDFDIEEELSDCVGNLYDDKVDKYLEHLPKIQQQIVMLLVDGYKPSEIRKELHISEREYTDHMLGIRTFENICILF